jgi:hypothetical protein
MNIESVKDVEDVEEDYSKERVSTAASGGSREPTKGNGRVWDEDKD